jgi:hypothetical protein
MFLLLRRPHVFNLSCSKNQKKPCVLAVIWISKAIRKPDEFVSDLLMPYWERIDHPPNVGPDISLFSLPYMPYWERIDHPQNVGLSLSSVSVIYSISWLSWRYCWYAVSLSGNWKISLRVSNSKVSPTNIAIFVVYEKSSGNCKLLTLHSTNPAIATDQPLFKWTIAIPLNLSSCFRTPLHQNEPFGLLLGSLPEE